MSELWKVFVGGVRESLNGFRPLSAAWRSGRKNGMPAAMKIFFFEIQRHWPDSLFSILGPLTVLIGGLAAAITIGSMAWMLIYPGIH